MKKLLLSYFILFVVIAFTACKKKDTTPSNTAKVMFVNGCAGAAAIDIAANSVNVPGATNIAFQKTTGYRTPAAGCGYKYRCFYKCQWPYYSINKLFCIISGK